MLQWLKRISLPALRPGLSEQATVRQYRLTRKLGEGGMGVVFEARDDRLDRLVAIKRLRPMDSHPSLKERLLREARVAAKISHPNICQVYELAEENGELFVVMEVLEGETLGGRIERGTLPLAEALQTALGVLGALEALHSRGPQPLWREAAFIPFLALLVPPRFTRSVGRALDWLTCSNVNIRLDVNDPTGSALT